MTEILEVTGATSLDGIEAEWQSLVARTADATPFQTWEWNATWWKHHGRGQLWILIAREGGVAVGLMPLTIARYRGTPLRQVRFMGAPLSDYQGILALPGREAACAEAFMMHLHHNAARWDLCDFADQREGSALNTSEAVARAVSGDGPLRVMRLHHRVCPVVPLAPTWEAFLAGLGKNMRTNLGRRRRQVAKTFKTEYDVASAETLPRAMEELFRLHNTRWRKRGAMGAFSGERMQKFHHEVARLFLERGWLRLHRLILDGETRAVFYCFHYGERVYYYLSGFDLELSKFSIGNVAMSAAIEDAIRGGAREFDLLRGDESYKFAWKAIERSTERLVIGHRSLRSRLAIGAHRFERFVEIQGLAVQRRLWGRKRAEKDKAEKPDAQAPAT